MRTLKLSAYAATLLVVASVWAGAATLQQLSFDDMILRSTAIVRGRVQYDRTAVSGRMIYTHYKVQVIEQWKGAPAAQIDVAAPGGQLNGLQQMVAGSPPLVNGQEYVLYLWTSRSGLNLIMGLSQGLFVSANGTVSRAAISDPMFDAAGNRVTDPGSTMSLTQMRTHVQAVLGK